MPKKRKPDNPAGGSLFFEMTFSALSADRQRGLCPVSITDKGIFPIHPRLIHGTPRGIVSSRLKSRKPSERRTCMKTKQTIAIVIVCTVVLLTAVIGVWSSGFFSGTETYSAEPYVSVIYITGTIGETSYDVFGNEISLSTDTICDYIDGIMDDDMNKGIFLAVDSPGGSVYDSDKIYQTLMEYKAYTGRPIKAGCMSMMASGAYYIAAAADEITAERTADVGSIGVYIEMIDASELMGKVGVKVDYIRSSENKAMGNMYNAMTDEQIAIYQSIVDEHYERFLDIVQESRGYSRAQLRKIADGRTYTATQALENGLIDAIMECDDALYAFEDELGVEYESYPYVYEESWFSAFFSNLISALPQSDAKTLEKLMQKRNGEVYAYAG